MIETDSAATANKDISTTPETSTLPVPEQPQASSSPPPAAIPAETVSVVTSSSSTSRPAQSSPSASPPPPVNEATRPSVPDIEPEERSPGRVRLDALRAMFPDYDDTILVSVLQSVDGNQDRAVDTLLGMSDPDYTTESRPEEPVLSQTDLDEQLARRLMLEDEQEQQRQWQMQQNTQRPQFIPQRQNSRSQQQVPYQQNAPASGERDTMAEFQEQFSKIAETGKKTFGTIFSKVKAKIQEFDQPRPGQSSAAGTQPAWGVNDNYGAYNPNQGQQASYGQGYQQQPSAHQQQAAYYDPNPPLSAPAARFPTSSPPVTAAAPKPYDMTSSQEPAPAAAAGSTMPGSDVPRTTSPTGQAVPIDGVKLGLLPKRPVSLMRDPAASQPQRKPSEDEDDGLEYAENPFEDSRK